MSYKIKCGFREEIGKCTFKDNLCTPNRCDLYKVDFYSKNAVEHKLEKINQKLIDLHSIEEFTIKHPFKDLKKTKQVSMFLLDLAAGKKTIKAAIEWHEKHKV